MNSHTDLCPLSLASLIVNWKKPPPEQAENICCTTEAFPCTSTHLYFPSCWAYMTELSVQQLPLRWSLPINTALLTKYLPVLHAQTFWERSPGEWGSKSLSLLPEYILHAQVHPGSQNRVLETQPFS